MGESNEHLLKVVRHCQESLDRYTENRNDGKLLHYLEKLYKLPIKVVHLEETGVGRTVNGLRKLGGHVGDSAKSLVSKWKEMVVGEQKAQDEEEDDDEDDDDDEDGYQTGEEQSESDDSDVSEETVVTTSSSHKKRDNNRTDERDKLKKVKNSSSKSDHTPQQSSSSRKEKDRHSKHNGHHKHKSHNKRKSEDNNSEDDSHRKRSRTSEDEDRHKRRKVDSQDESRTQEKKHKSEKHRSDSKKRSRESSDGESSHKTAKSKDAEKDKHKLHKKRHEHSSKTKEVEKKSKHKEKPKERSDEKKVKKEKVVNGGLVQNGIDSGSGASFAEALGMCEPSSSKGSSKKKSLEKREKSVAKVEDPVPKLLKEPTVEPLDINIASLLPSITPNYRPLGNALSSEMQPKKFLSESETLSNIISSKNQRTKVYSGNKTGNGKVSSLFELCIRILQDNIDALEYTGGVPYNILKPILEKATPNQLYTMEHHNPYLIDDTDELWQLHCQKGFRNKPRQELETCREMYLRCLDEQDAKLKALTANIKQAQDKSLPVRMTKLAYVDAVAKPPRNIARKQAKNGTASDARKPTLTPTAKLSSLATAGDAGKIAVPNPGGRAFERSSSHAAKPKKAPLMLKSITSFKNRFKR